MNKYAFFSHCRPGTTLGYSGKLKGTISALLKPILELICKPVFEAKGGLRNIIYLQKVCGVL